MLDYSAPLADDLDVAIFGKGIGECIVAHVPQYGWIVIDSFLHDGQPIACSYLEKIGLSCDEVKLVLLTHWHDDHVKGAGQLFSRCQNARLAIPAAFKADEFRGFLSSGHSAGGTNFSSGVRELIDCLSVCAQRKVTPIFCIANRVLGRNGSTELECLSPTDADIQQMLNDLPKLFADKVGRIPAPNRNDTAVALLIAANENLILLGADLENGSPGRGWNAVCSDAWTRATQASLVKVPHHGSPNAFAENLWSDRILRTAPAVIVPYARGVRKLPQLEDIARIREYNEEIYLAADNALSNKKHPNRIVAKTMANANVKVTVRSEKIGLVRLRWRNGTSTWETEMDGSARAA